MLKVVEGRPCPYSALLNLLVNKLTGVPDKVRPLTEAINRLQGSSKTI
jgi:hypothetical protein